MLATRADPAMFSHGERAGDRMQIRGFYARSSARRTALAVVGVVAAIAVVAGLGWHVVPILDRHEGTAAWVQAAGAIIIIAATACIASRNFRETQERERIAKQQMSESIAALSRNWLCALDSLLKYYTPPPTSDPCGNFRRSHAPSDFDVPIDGLAAVPLHQIGDAALITAVLNLRGIMGRIKKHLDDVRESKGVMPFSLDLVRSQRTPAFNAVASVLRIVGGSTVENEMEISRLASRA